MRRALAVALTCLAATTLVSCSRVPEATVRSSGTGTGTGTATATGGGALFADPQPWTADVSAAPASERGPAVLAALTATADEVASGRVGHALRFVLPNDRMKAGVYVPPATHAGGPENPDPDAPPYGVHLRLRPDLDTSAFTASQRVVLTALQTYGMYLSDGGEIALTFADDRPTTAKWADLGIEAQSFGALTVGDFEVVDHGPEVPATDECARVGSSSATLLGSAR